MEPNNRRGSSTPPGLEQRSASSGAGGLRSWNQNRTQRPPGQWSHLTKENQPTWEVNVALWTRYPRWWYPKYPSEVRHEHRPSGPRRRAQRETSRFLTSIGSLERTPRFTSPKPTLIRVRRDQTGSSIRQQHLWFQQLQNKQRSQMGVRRPKASPLIYIFPSSMHVPSLTVPRSGPSIWTFTPSVRVRSAPDSWATEHILRWSSGTTEQKSHLRDSLDNFVDRTRR